MFYLKYLGITHDVWFPYLPVSFVIAFVFKISKLQYVHNKRRNHKNHDILQILRFIQTFALYE